MANKDPLFRAALKEWLKSGLRWSGLYMTRGSIVRNLQAPAVTFALLALPLATAAADVLFSNPTPFDNHGNCVFNTACGNVWAAQEFSLGNAATVISASFTAITQDPNFTFAVKLPTAVNWSLWQANGLDGLPASLVVQGSDDPIVSSQFLAYGSFLASKPYFQQTFNLPAVSLPAGNYYIAFQALNSDPGVYLSDGVLPSGAAGLWGSEWIATYDDIPSVAVNVYGGAGAVGAPEPGAFALLVAGLLGLSWTARVRRGRLALP